MAVATAVDAVKLNAKYERLLEVYDSLVEDLSDVLFEADHGGTYTDQTLSVMENVMNAHQILTALGRFLPDSLPAKLYT